MITRDRLRLTLLNLARDERYPGGPCWCGMADGDPGLKAHTFDCVDTRAVMAALDAVTVVRPESCISGPCILCQYDDAEMPYCVGVEGHRSHAYPADYGCIPVWCPLRAGPLWVEGAP